MPKNRDRSSDEWYRGKIRELEKENRQLKKRIKQLEKYDKNQETVHEILKEHETHLRRLAELEVSNYEDMCPSCFKGKLVKKITLRGKDYFECASCEHRLNRPSKEQDGD